MKRNVRSALGRVLCLALFGIAAACQSVQVTTDYDRKMDFSNVKTYAIYRLTDSGPGLSELNRDRILDAVNAELKAKGFVENPSKPDVLVNITAVAEEKKQITATNYYRYGGVYRPYYWGPAYAGQTQINVSELTEGSLIIDILDASTRKLIWEGVGNQEIDLPMKNADKIIPRAVKAILEKFPPKDTSK